MRNVNIPFNSVYCVCVYSFVCTQYHSLNEQVEGKALRTAGTLYGALFTGVRRVLEWKLNCLQEPIVSLVCHKFYFEN